MAWFLEAHFGPVEMHPHDPVLVVRVDGEEARVGLVGVACAHEGLRERVESVVGMAELTVRSLDGL